MMIRGLRLGICLGKKLLLACTGVYVKSGAKTGLRSVKTALFSSSQSWLGRKGEIRKLLREGMRGGEKKLFLLKALSCYRKKTVYREQWSQISTESPVEAAV